MAHEPRTDVTGIAASALLGSDVAGASARRRDRIVAEFLVLEAT